jgi:hypothetical protein
MLDLREFGEKLCGAADVRMTRHEDWFGITIPV